MTAYYMGVDLGSTTAKTVILDAAGDIRAAEVVQMGAVSRAGLARSVTAAFRAAGGTADAAGVGALRPKRARITGTPP